MGKDIIKEINDFIDLDKLIDAKRLAKELISKDPSSIDGYLALSDIYYEESNFKKSLEIINAGLENTPNNKRLLENKIDAEMSLLQYEDAKNTINILLDIKEASANTYGKYGVILSMEGKYKEAIEKYKQAIKIDEEDVVSMINMSIAYKAIYKYDDALGALERAYLINPSKSIEKRLNSMKKVKEASLFTVDALVPLQAKPDKFNLLIPKDFNARMENGILYIENVDNRIAVILSYNETAYDEKSIRNTFTEFRNESGKLYSIIRPFSIIYREKYNDNFSSMIFTSKISNKDMFYAMAIISKKNESITLTFSSSILVSDNLITLAENIIESIYFKSNE